MTTPRIGCHLPISKGLQHTAAAAVSLGLEALQMFIRNPRGRGARSFKPEELEFFKNTLQDNDMGPVAVHIPYICNPAAARDDLFQFACQVVSEDLKRCSLVNADFLILHPGSYTTSSLEQGIERIVLLLNQVLDEYEGPVCLLLETMAGQGTEIGRSFQELNLILQQVRNQAKIGVCFDTCHTFAAGYDCTTGEGINSILAEMDKTFGRDRVKLIHANDSTRELGSHRDRHAHIGQGMIGRNGFQLLMQNSFLGSLPFILETPLEAITDDIEALKEIRRNII